MQAKENPLGISDAPKNRAFQLSFLSEKKKLLRRICARICAESFDLVKGEIP